MSDTRSTVLIVTPEETRSVEVNTRLLLNMRPLLWGMGAAIAVLFGVAAYTTAGYLGQRHSLQSSLQEQQAQMEQEAQARQKQIDELSKQLDDLRQAKSAEVDAKLAELKKSERMLADLREYLKARGVNVKPSALPTPKGRNDAAGGPLTGVLVKGAGAALHAATRMAGDAGDLLSTLQSVPLGLPHSGPISSRFGGRSNPFTGKGHEFHGGLDFKGSTGDPIRATARGKVSFAGVQSGYGKVVIVEHAHGYRTVYAHLSAIEVKQGQNIDAGRIVGKLGSTGRSTGPHLHYEVQYKAQRTDPEQFLTLTAPVTSLGDSRSATAVP